MKELEMHLYGKKDYVPKPEGAVQHIDLAEVTDVLEGYGDWLHSNKLTVEAFAGKNLDRIYQLIARGDELIQGSKKINPSDKAKYNQTKERIILRLVQYDDTLDAVLNPQSTLRADTLFDDVRVNPKVESARSVPSKSYKARTDWLR